jgi:hypothetical protein
MASIEGNYRGPLTSEDARAAAEHLRGGGAPEDVLPERRFVGDYGRRATAQEENE